MGCVKSRGGEHVDDIQKLTRQKKFFLKRFRKNKSCIIRLQNKLYILESRLKSPKPINYSDMPKGGPISLDDLMADKVDLEKRIDKLVSKGERIKCEIINEIDNIDDPRYCEILEAYFIDCMDMEDIADNMGYGLRHTYKLYSDAITQLLNYDNDKSLK